MEGWRVRRHLFVSFAILAILVAACSSTPASSSGGSPSATTSGAATGTKILSIGEGVEQPTLDPALDPLCCGDEMPAIYDTLVVLNTDNSIGPALATSWTQDATSLTFKLRTGVKFQDGTPFNAAAVKAFLDRATSPAGAAGNAASLIPSYASSTVVDDSTIKITWKAPFSTALIDFSNGSMGIPSPTAGAAGTLANHPVGTGPFEFVEWVKGDHLTLKRNPDYSSIRQDLTNKGPALVDEIVFRYSTNATTLANLLTTGGIQLTRLVGPDATRLMTSTQVQHLLQPSIFERWLAINTKHITDVNVRTAIMEAIDRSAVLAAGGNVGTEHYSVIPSQIFGWDKNIDAQVQALLPKYDPAGAKQLLATAGYTAGSDGTLTKGGKPFTLDLLTISGDPYSAEAQVIQDDLSQVGIKVTVRALDSATVISERQKGTQDMFLGRYGILDPVLDTQFIFSCNSIPNPPAKTGANISFYCNQDFDNVINQATSVTDPTQLKSLLDKAQLDLATGAAMFALHEPSNAYFFSKSVSGVEQIAEGALKVNDLSLTQ